jgi:hypothetical protein
VALIDPTNEERPSPTIIGQGVLKSTDHDGPDEAYTRPAA